MAKMTKIRIDGLKELDRALGQLPKATAKATLRRVLKESAEPMARAARSKAPIEEGYLHESIDVSTRLNKAQSVLHRQEKRRDFQEMFVGTNNPAGVFQEFGTGPGHVAQPFMRPAWDGTKQQTLDQITTRLWGEIERSAARLAKKAAKGK